MEEEIISIRDFLVKVENGEITKEQLENWAAKGYFHRVVGTILKVVG